MENGVKVTVLPHPFADDGTRHDLPAGLSIAEIVERVRPGMRAYLRAWIGGHFIPEENWARVYPKAGAALDLRLIPAGGGGRGGGKNPARMIVSLALASFAPILGPLSQVIGGRTLSLGMSFLGRLLFNALSPPARPRVATPKESPTLFIQGARNAVTPFARVPRVLGVHRMVPPLGANAYSETSGDDQYLRMLFVWGYGPLEISDLKIGETPLQDFTDVEIETRQGYPGDAPLTLYSDSVIQNDLQVAVTNAGGYAVRTSEENADELSVDITFPRGLFIAGDQGRLAATVTVTVGWSPTGAGTWTDETFTWTAAQGAALRRDARFVVPRGQYDVRVSRVTPDATTDNVVDDSLWTALRTVRYAAPILMPGIAMTALRIKATDQLNGVIDRFNGVVASVLPDWDGTAWTPRVTSNPASLFRHVLQGAANARPLDDARIDLARLQSWHDSCAAAGREFNGVIDTDASVREVLQAVAAAGRASPAVVDGLWSVAVDEPQAAPVQHFTPRNTWGFSGEKSFDEVPHALRVRFVNRDKGWLQDEILAFDDGYDATTATKYDALDLTGVTDAAQAWSDARYHIASARLRPETYTFSADIEHIVCTRGDLVRFTHDVPLFGLASARVKSVAVSGGNAVGVTLDTDILMEDGLNYAVRFRLQDGTSLAMPLLTVTGTTNGFSFAAPCPAASGPQPGDLALFGESGQDSVELIVKSIEPQGDLAAKLTCVDAAPAVHTADEGPIPAFSPQITVPPEMRRPPAPDVAGLSTADGDAVITLSPPGFPLPLSVSAKLRFPEETDFRPARFTVSGAVVTITDLTPGLHYDIALYYNNVSGVSSAATVLPNLLIAGTGGIPSDVANLALNIVGRTAHLTWDAAPDIDLDHYSIRFNNSITGVTWASSFEAAPPVPRGSTSAAVPAQVGTWLVKAVNTAGHESLNAAPAVSPLDRVDGQEVRASADETPHFSGAMTAGSSGVMYTGDHRLVLGSGVSDGTYYFAAAVDLGAVYPVTMSAAIDVLGVSVTNLIDGWNAVDRVADWDGSADPSTWEIGLQLRTTNDNPAGSPAWSDWRDFAVGAATARAAQFRLQLASEVAGVTPSVAALKVDFSMFDWAQGRSDLTGAAGDSGGTRVIYPDAFHDATAVTVTPHNLAAGDYYTVTGRDETGFSVSFFNSSAARVTRTFDYIATGIGRKI